MGGPVTRLAKIPVLATRLWSEADRTRLSRTIHAAANCLLIAPELHPEAAAATIKAVSPTTCAPRRLWCAIRVVGTERSVGRAFRRCAATAAYRAGSSG